MHLYAAVLTLRVRVTCTPEPSTALCIMAAICDGDFGLEQEAKPAV